MASAAVSLIGWAPLDNLPDDTEPAGPPVATADGTAGDTPYIPSRLEWASLLANATLGRNLLHIEGWAVRFLPGQKGSNTLHVILSYDPNKIDKETIASKVNYHRGALESLAKVQGWDAWLRVEVKLEREHVREESEIQHAHHISKGLTLQRSGEAEGAVAEFTKAVVLRPDIFTGYVNRGNAYHQLGDWEAALRDFETAKRIAPGAYLVWNNIAWLRATCPDERVRDGAQALEAAKKACDLTKWNDFATLSTLAAAHAELGEFDEAIQRQKHCLELAPEEMKLELTRMLEQFELKHPWRDGAPDN